MYLVPSEIHFLRDYTSCDCLTSDETLLTALCDSLVKANGDWPKMQVVKRNGIWFALNNNHLHVFRQLERQGKCPCGRVRVDVVPLSKVPTTIQETMVVMVPEDVRSTASIEETVGCDDENRFESSHPDDRQDGQPLEDDLGKESPTRSVDAILDAGYGRPTKRGYQKLSDGVGDDEESSAPETEITTSSFSGTDYSDCDRDSDSDYDEYLTCNVCDRSFPTVTQLTQHQQRKRHHGCSVCDSIFPSLMTLELHKESVDHWSEDDDSASEPDEDLDDDDRSRRRPLNRSLLSADDSDADVHTPTEELERLL